jgi:predicted dehydrogenase
VPEFAICYLLSVISFELPAKIIMSHPINAILVGCGAMSGEWLRAASELNVQIVALVDLDQRNAEKRRNEFNLSAPIYSDFQETFRSVPADAVFDCTIPAAHKEVSGAALAAGFHVLEEKPLALTVADASDLVELARRSARVHAVVQNRRFNRGIRQMRKMLEAGVIGEVTTVHVDFFAGPHFGGFRESMPHVLLADMAIHPFDAVRFLLGVDAEAVFCDEWLPKNSWYRYGPSVAAIFRMANGIRFTYRASWCADGFRTSWDGTWRIIGTEGTLVWDGYEEVKAELVKFQEGVFLNETQLILPNQEPLGSEIRGHFSVMNQFVEAVRRGPMPETSSADNIRSLAMVLAAIESVETGQWRTVRNDK